MCCVVGFYKWDKFVLLMCWFLEENFYFDEDVYMLVLDFDVEGMEICEWEMESGDVVVFNFVILYGVWGNEVKVWWWVFFLCMIGDDVCYVEWSGCMFFLFSGYDMVVG